MFAFQVKEWLCLNCQMQRALGASEPPGLPMIKPQPSPSKEVPATTQKKDIPMLTSQEDIPKPATPKNECVNVATMKETESPALGAPTKKVSPIADSLPDKTVPSTITKTDVSLASQKPSLEIPKGQPGPLQQQLPKAMTSTTESAPSSDLVAGKTSPQQSPKAVTSVAKSAPLPDQETGKPPPQQPPQVVTSIVKSAPSPDQEAGKPPPQQPPKAVTSIAKAAFSLAQEAGTPTPQQPPKAGGTPPAKSVPPPAQPAKQESGGFFGFGGPKTQPTAAKSSESVTGKMFGFGSSFLSSASTLITSAVQDEPKTTPPTPRKMSTTGHVSPKATPPASPKTLPVKDTMPPAVQKTEEKKTDKQEKTPSTVQAKVDKAPSEPPKASTDIQGAPKADQPVCPLCKVDLNMGSKDPPNYDTCTECKTAVCNQCGFNPMPNVAEVNHCCLCFNLTYYFKKKVKKVFI